MQQKIVLKLSPAEAANEAIIIQNIGKAALVKDASITGYSILKKSIDARGKNIYINLTVNAFINEPNSSSTTRKFTFQNVFIVLLTIIPLGFLASFIASSRVGKSFLTSV